MKYSICACFLTLATGTAHAEGNPYDTAPAWSADGQTIYFYSYRHGTAELYKMDSDGNHQTRLTETDHNEWWAFTTKDPQKLVVVSDRDSGGNFKGANLFLLDLATNEMRNLTGLPEGMWAARADVASEVNTLIYAESDSFRAEEYRIKTVDLETFEIEDYGDDPAHQNSNPSITPDGSMVAYNRTDGDLSAIYLNDLTGKNERPLLTVRGEIPMMRLSPDGKWVAFSLGASARMAVDQSIRTDEQDVYLAATDGGSFKRLTSTPGSDHGASWSPDGKTIAFASYRHGPADIFAVNTDGNNERNLTRTSIHHESDD